jgi:hypothetical protein
MSNYRQLNEEKARLIIELEANKEKLAAVEKTNFDLQSDVERDRDLWKSKLEFVEQ